VSDSNETSFIQDIPTTRDLFIDEDIGQTADVVVCEPELAIPTNPITQQQRLHSRQARLSFGLRLELGFGLKVRVTKK
jgi:hypothetical protein